MNTEKANFVNGSFVVLASRPDMGKTALALDIARHMAGCSEKNILIISLELSKEQVMARLRKADDTEYRNILVDDYPLRSVKDIEELCQNTENLGAVIILYLQLLSDARYTREKAITWELKRMAKQLNIPVICTSSVSWAVNMREDKRPILTDFCHTSVVDERDADQVLFLYRDRYYNPETPVGDMAECIIAKNRYGDVGTVKLRWNPERLAFSLWEA